MNIISIIVNKIHQNLNRSFTELVGILNNRRYRRIGNLCVSYTVKAYKLDIFGNSFSALL